MAAILATNNLQYKNPIWQRDELILALDLYFQLEPGQIDDRNPRIQELSHLLNKLPIHSEAERDQKFRNPNGVCLKLSNFKAIDPNYTGAGMTRIGKLDKIVFEEFCNDRQQLSHIASQIRVTLADPRLVTRLYQVYDEEEYMILREVKEGKVLYRLHRLRERNARIIQEKKDYVYKKVGALLCEACDFDFERVYGKLGAGYIECHHNVPLAECVEEKVTRLEDLALVCANCHRMLHRGISNFTVPKLKQLISI